MSETAAPVYDLEDVSVTYRAHGKQIPVLAGFRLDVLPGERLVLRGASGAGKTTILNVMAGFVTPTSGQVRFNGRDLSTLTSREMAAYRNGQIGIVHQFFNLIPAFSSLVNVAAPLRIAGYRRAQANELAMEMLERVGVASRAEHFPSEISGGEQQRVAIARALVRKPSVVLADEPTGNLDAATSSTILSLLDEVVGGDVTMVVATHDELVTEFGTRIIDCEQGLAGAEGGFNQAGQPA